jgi:ubiquitin carboxyl-terminal hydrolase 7
VQEELMTGADKYTIEGKGKVDAMRGTKFLELPPVLHLHLERFAYDPASGGVRKVTDAFAFPFELDMAPYMADNVDRSQCFTYELASVLVHWGTQMGGHYYAFCRPTIAREWFKFNDHEVERVDEAKVIADNFGGFSKHFSAYFLVYVRKSDIERVMQLVPETAIRPHLHEYFHEWKQKHRSGPEEYRIQIVSDETYAIGYRNLGLGQNPPEIEKFITVPSEYKFNDFLSLIKSQAGLNPGDECSLWFVSKANVPIRRIDTNVSLKSRFTDPRKVIYVSSFASDPVPDEVALLVVFYDPSILTYPLQYVLFTVLSAGQT